MKNMHLCLKGLKDIPNLTVADPVLAVLNVQPLQCLLFEKGIISKRRRHRGLFLSENIE